MATIAHIVEAGYLNVEPLIDPIAQPEWLRADSADLLTFATPILGPTATLMVHRFAVYFANGDTYINFLLDDLGATFGVGGIGDASPLLRAIDRIERFGFGRIDTFRPLLRVRPSIPPLSRRLARRLPGYLADICPYVVR